MPATKTKNKKTKHGANPMWGGQYATGPAEIMMQINPSIGFDKKMYAQDISGSIAHCTMLAATGIITKKEADAIIGGLQKICKEIEAGDFEFRDELEDIHMNVEARLSQLIGDTAGKLHTARSRNDQAVLDFRLYVRDTAKVVDSSMQKLQAALIAKAEKYHDAVMPGFTHLQAAQPVTFGHHLMAYVEMIGRDRSRIADFLKRTDECPLGAAALAGTSFPIDRVQTAKLLGFSRPTANSMDSVSDRDHAIEFLSIASMCAMHLSRLAEEFILWCSPSFGFIKFSDLFTTGSSIMPQKRNPDAAELVRGKSGRIMGALVSLLVMMKGQPLAFNKDMQEDKEPTFDAAHQLNLILLAMAGMVDDLVPDVKRMKALAGYGYSTATDLADWLVKNLKMPFRNAHHVTAKIVKIASTNGSELTDLTLHQMQSIEPRITKDVFNVLSVEKSVASRTSFGGTSPVRVKEAVKAAKKKYL